MQYCSTYQAYHSIQEHKRVQTIQAKCMCREKYELMRKFDERIAQLICWAIAGHSSILHIMYCTTTSV